MPSVSIDEQMSFVMDYLRIHGPTTVLRLVAHMTDKIRIVVTIIALLELTKNRAIRLLHGSADGDIEVLPAEHAAVYQEKLL